VDEDGGTACLARNGIDGRDALVARWPRLAGGKTRAVAMSSSDGNGAFASVVLGKGFPFITIAGCNGLLTIRVSGVDNTELDNGQPVRF
jgi:hypothetical protein